MAESSVGDRSGYGTAGCGSVTVVNPLESSAWTTLIASPEATVFHSPEWMRVVNATYGTEFRAVVLERHGKPVAGVAFSEADDLVGRRRSTLPASDVCDIIASNPDDARVVADALIDGAIPWTLRTRTRNVVPLRVPGHVRGSYALQTIDLRPPEEELWDRLSSMARRGVRKAEREAVTVRAATNLDELREWFLLHLRVRRHRHHLLAQPFTFFEHIWDTFITRDLGILLLAECDGKIIGGDLFLCWHNLCYYKTNASDPVYLHLRPNNAMLWHGILEAKARGAVSLDLGRSPRDNAGLISFKAGFGANEEDVQIIDYEACEDETEARREGEARELLRSLTQLFVRDDVSEQAAEEAAERLYRYFV